METRRGQRKTREGERRKNKKVEEETDERKTGATKKRRGKESEGMEKWE